jgi:RNA polymerase sigma factor (sigma-70 family)
VDPWPTDRELLRRLAEGDREALAPLAERHYVRLYRIALSYLRDRDDALDAVQETFVKAFQNANRWDQASQVAPWLTRICINQSIDQYRRNKRRGERSDALDAADHDERFAGPGPSPEQQAAGAQLGARIQRALKVLPRTQRSVFVLRHYDGRSLEEIARALGISLGTVKSSLHRALHRLRDELREVRA